MFFIYELLDDLRFIVQFIEQALQHKIIKSLFLDVLVSKDWVISDIAISNIYIK
jgi:hypothetical protein